MRTISRSQVVRFYLCSLRQTDTFRNLGGASMLSYLTGFRAAEVLPNRGQDEGRRHRYQLAPGRRARRADAHWQLTNFLARFHHGF